MAIKRHEALRLVQNNLNIIISDLETLEARVKPELAKEGIKDIQVGVHLGHTCEDGFVKYFLVAVDPIMRMMHTVDYDKLLSSAVKEYKDRLFYSVRSQPAQGFYSKEPVLSLDLLKDMQAAAQKQ